MLDASLDNSGLGFLALRQHGLQAGDLLFQIFQLPLLLLDLLIELLREDCAIQGEAITWLHQESGELMAIFATIVSKLRKRGA